MTLPRSIPRVPAAATGPRRVPATPSPWDLTEFTAPAVPLAAPRAPGSANHYSAAEVGRLREEMQAQHVAALADARRAGLEEGRAAGRAEAHEAAERRVADTLEALHAAIAAVKQQEEHYVGILEENLTALACAVARQVIQREVQLDPSAIRELVQAALNEFPQETTLKVRLHPHDHAMLAADPGYRDVTWIADPRIVRGGCVVEGRERVVDGRVDLALEQIFRVLTGLDA